MGGLLLTKWGSFGDVVCLELPSVDYQIVEKSG
jgi:hypothetical protein